MTRAAPRFQANKYQMDVWGRKEESGFSRLLSGRILLAFYRGCRHSRQGLRCSLARQVRPRRIPGKEDVWSGCLCLV